MSPKRAQIAPNRNGFFALVDCVLPEEIMLCILTRLPVKSILRFKSVCKHWADLFSTREFMKMHQGQYSSDPKHQSFIIINDDENISLFEIESDETKPTILDHPHPKTRTMEIVGSCNGLICLGAPNLGPGNIVLWNPAMKLFKFVRSSENENVTDIVTMSLGFGYDAERDDYKVVRIVCFLEKGEGNVGVWVEVYSANTDSWITIKPDFNFRVFLNESTLLVNGNPYWIAEVEDGDGFRSHFSKSLVCFDVRRMVFKAVPLNNRNFDRGTEDESLIDWKGSLASLVCTRDRGKGIQPLRVLVFDEDDQIWRKVHTFGPIGVYAEKVWVCFKNEKMMCYKGGRLLVFDPVNGRVKVYDELLSRFNPHSPHLYTERLTCIIGMESEPEKEENYFCEGPSKN